MNEQMNLERFKDGRIIVDNCSDEWLNEWTGQSLQKRVDLSAVRLITSSCWSRMVVQGGKWGCYCGSRWERQTLHGHFHKILLASDHRTINKHYLTVNVSGIIYLVGRDFMFMLFNRYIYRIHFLLIYPIIQQGLPSGERQGYTPDKSAAHRRLTHRTKQTFTLTFLPKFNLVSPVHRSPLKYVFGLWEEAGVLERTNAGRGKPSQLHTVKSLVPGTTAPPSHPLTIDKIQPLLASYLYLDVHT